MPLMIALSSGMWPSENVSMKDLAVETPRLHLRRMTREDVPALLRVFGGAEVMRFYPVPFDEARMHQRQRAGASVG